MLGTRERLDLAIDLIQDLMNEIEAVGFPVYEDFEERFEEIKEE